MGWQDSLAKHHPIPAFFAAVISNVITGKKADEDQNSSEKSYDSDQRSSPDHDHAYGPSEFQPPQYYYPPPQTPSRSSYKKPKKKKNMTYNDGYEEDYYYNNNNTSYDDTSYDDTGYEPVVKSKGLWGRKDKHLHEKGKGYGVRGTVTRSYTDWKGEEVTEEREYEYQSYYELQMTPARVVDKGKNRSTDYQGAGRSRSYYEDEY